VSLVSIQAEHEAFDVAWRKQVPLVIAAASSNRIASRLYSCNLSICSPTDGADSSSQGEVVSLPQSVAGDEAAYIVYDVPSI